MSVPARRIVETMRAQRVTHVVSLPDNASAALLALLREGDEPRLVSVTREGEAFAIAAGLWVGGARPLVLIQNTGLLESGDALRGTAMRMRVPVVCLVTVRGYATLARAPGAAPGGEVLSRPDVDSVAVLTEPTLAAWGLPFTLLREDAELPRLAQAFAEADRLQQPVAVLLPGETA
jgi:sulfopyruvate decarboxylase TPP-binding subunit